MHPRRAIRCSKGMQFGWVKEYRGCNGKGHTRSFLKKNTIRRIRNYEKREITEELYQCEIDRIDDAIEMNNLFGYYNENDIDLGNTEL
jgi:hypothetical protein